MHASVDELRFQNQTLDENVHNIIQRQHDSNPPKEMEVLNPHPHSDEIWETPLYERLKPLSLDKFDGRSESYKHVTSLILFQLHCIFFLLL